MWGSSRGAGLGPASLHPNPQPHPTTPTPGTQDFTGHIGQAHVANFATPREGSAAPYRFLFHAQAAGSSAHVLVQVGAAWGGAQGLQSRPGCEPECAGRQRGMLLDPAGACVPVDAPPPAHLQPPCNHPMCSPVQVTISQAPPAAAVVVKSGDAAAAAHVEELLQTLLLTL